jgi:hypothetical protein
MRINLIRLKDANSSDTWRPPNLYKLEFSKFVENCKEKESIDSIKFQAPKSFSAQGRAVSKNDYISVLQKNNYDNSSHI